MADNKALDTKIEAGKALAKTLFEIRINKTQSELEFTARIQKIADERFHSPLLHFSEFQFHWNSFTPPTKADVYTNWSPDLIPEVEDNVFIFPKLKGSTAGMFLTIGHLKTETKNLISNQIQKADSISLLGVISLPSFYETAIWLEEHNFHGTLKVFDLSQIPLEIISIYKEKGLLPKSFNIELNKKNILEDHFSTKSDIIMTDVLGYYLDKKSYQKLEIVVNKSLNPQGLWITRELVEPQGKPEQNKRTVTLDRQSNNERLINLGNFIKKYMGSQPPHESLEEFENTRWLSLPTYTRQGNDEYFDLPQSLKMVDSIAATSEALSPSNQPSRIFYTSIIQK